MSHSKRFARGSVFDHRRQPAPDYFARHMQWKILGLVFLALAVMALMMEARKPENWDWMWRFPGDPQTRDKAGSESPLDEVGVGSLGGPFSEANEPDGTVEPTRNARATPITPDQLLEGTVAQSLRVAHQAGWNHVMDALGGDERQQVLDLLWRQRQRQPWDAELQDAWPRVLDRIERVWTDYHARGLMSVAQDDRLLTDAQKRQCLEVLESLRETWQRQVEVLRAMGERESLTADQIRTLEALQQVLDQRALAAIEDAQVLRAAETEAWFRSWEILAAIEPDELAQAPGPVSHVQLSAQSPAYRGKLIAIQGVARLGYRVPARPNRCGIEHYYVLWIRGVDQSNSPLVAYCRELPDGFPALAWRDDQVDGTPLDEPVRLAGIFFKRWLYPSRGGLDVAPLILARVTNWTPAVTDSSRESAVWLSEGRLALVFLTAALVGTLVAWLAFRSERRPLARAGGESRDPVALPPIDSRDVHPGVADALRRLAQEDTNARPLWDREPESEEIG